MELAKSSKNRHYERGLTWNNITRVHRILVLNEAEATHELDLSDLASAMAVKVLFDVLLGG